MKYDTWFIFQYLESILGVHFRKIKYIRFIMLMRIVVSLIFRGKYLPRNKPTDPSFI